MYQSHRKVALVLGATTLLAGCWSPDSARLSALQAGNMTGRAVGVAAESTGPVIDLSDGKALKSGFGRLTVKLRGPSIRRSVQAVGTQYAIIVVTKPGGGEVTDENGDDAVYWAPVDTGVATFILPGLPPTTTEVSGPQTANAYVVNALVGDWDGFVGPDSYEDLTSGDLAYGSRSEGTFSFDNLGKDLVSSEVTPSVDSMLLASAWGRGDVTSGVTPVVQMTTYTHFQNSFQQSPVSLEGSETVGSVAHGLLINKGAENVTSLSNLTVDSTGALRLRQPAMDPDGVDVLPRELGSIPTHHKPARLLVQLTSGGSSFDGFSPIVTGAVYDPAAGTTSELDTPASNQALTTTVTAFSNPGYSLANTLAWTDIDLAGPTAGPSTFTIEGLVNSEPNVVDFTLTGLPPGATARVYFLPLGTAYIMSGPFTPNTFE